MRTVIVKLNNIEALKTQIILHITKKQWSAYSGYVIFCHCDYLRFSENKNDKVTITISGKKQQTFYNDENSIMTLLDKMVATLDD